MTAAIVCSDLSFSWPDGVPVLSGLTASFGPGRTGLIGVNGSGKSTLLRAIAGLAPLPGVGVRLGAVVGYLPQALEAYRGAVLVASHDLPFCAQPGSPGGSAWTAMPASSSSSRRDRGWIGRRVPSPLDCVGAPRGAMPLGYGVIGSPTGSGPVSLGSSPGTPASSADSADTI
jgi:hypothetical protein